MTFRSRLLAGQGGREAVLSFLVIFRSPTVVRVLSQDAGKSETEAAQALPQRQVQHDLDWMVVNLFSMSAVPEDAAGNLLLACSDGGLRMQV